MEDATNQDVDIAEQTHQLFELAKAKYAADAGEKPHIYHLCLAHRASVLAHIRGRASDSIAEVQRQHCIMCKV